MTQRIYSRRGDNGVSDSAGGKRLPKDDSLFRAGGSLDEMAAHLALVAALAEREGCTDQTAVIQELLELLFKVGADVSRANGQSDLRKTDIKRLEAVIDELSSDLPPLRGFLVPGGSPLLAQTAVTRTIARRAEREMVRAAREHQLPVILLGFLNRLSDYLFTLERHFRRCLKLPEVGRADTANAKETESDD